MTPDQVRDAARPAPLPARRPHVTTLVRWGGQEWLIGVGLDAEGRCREVFADGAKTGGQMEGLLDDACILLSLLLQEGHDVAELAERLGREGVNPREPAASPIGAIARQAAEIEAASDGWVAAEARRVERLALESAELAP